MGEEIQLHNNDITEIYPEGYSFNLSDFALFLSVMKEKKAYQNVLSIILDDGTKKFFLNMSSKNGSKELVSLLHYMKNTTLDNPEIQVKDERIIELDKIVTEVKESKEVKMNILEIGMAKGEQIGMTKGEYKKLIS